jgi:hypothetical protein
LVAEIDGRQICDQRSSEGTDGIDAMGPVALRASSREARGLPDLNQSSIRTMNMASRRITRPTWRPMTQEGSLMRLDWVAIAYSVIVFGGSFLLVLIMILIEPRTDPGQRSTVLPTHHVAVK